MVDVPERGDIVHLRYWQERRARRKENVPAYLLDEVMGKIEAILFS
jgi:hypothetical protein